MKTDKVAQNTRIAVPPEPEARTDAKPTADAGAAQQIVPASPLSVREARALQKTVSVTAAPAAIEEKAYDYVFIGAGATGGTAAADLSALLTEAEDLRQKGFKVLVLEGGADKPVEMSKIPIEHALASEHPDLAADPNRTGRGTGYWVTHYADQKQAEQDPKATSAGKIWKPRGEGFGGSTRVNANVFIRVDDVDWQKIAIATGDPSFRPENMKAQWKELEKNEYRPVLKMLHELGNSLGWDALKNMGGHGFDGKLEITTANPRLLLADPQLAEVALKGLWWTLTRIGSPMDKMKRLAAMFDPNDDLTQRTEGPVLMPTTITKDGQRNGARDILSKAAAKYPDQLTLASGVRVQNVVLDDDNRCTGVRYVDQNGRAHVVGVNREAIVSAGSLETPSLLMRSGIGPADQLAKLAGDGVTPKVILSGVGKNQGDREEVGMVFRLKRPLKLLQDVKLPAGPDDPNYQRWAAGKGGPLATNGAVLSFQMKSDPSLAESDLFIFAVPGNFRGYWIGEDNKVKVAEGEKKVGYAEDAAADPSLMTFLVLHANKGHNFGTIEVDPNNPLGAPIVNHHFEDEAKGQAVLAGVKKVRELVESQFKGLVESEVWPGPDAKTDQQLQAKIDAEKWGHHPRGGAQMGHPNDPNTVVDSNFRVLGTTGLRVIDASMLPDNIGTFIVSGLYQIGELAAKKIAADASDGPKPAATYNPLSIQLSPPPANLKQAQEVTKSAAGAAKSEGLISEAAYKRLTDGTVSKVDVDVAWAAIETVLKGPDKESIGSDRHTLAHNLLLAVSQQLDKQGAWQTNIETIGDRLRTTLGAS